MSHPNHLIFPETKYSRRYQNLLELWIPFAASTFSDWPDRPDCGHFFGGVHWYGQETGMTMAALAIAVTSPEYNADRTGLSADELRTMVRKALRYLCFTHDTGPADCVRPRQGWGRPEPAGTKWGERGAGFFRESQCGNTIHNLAIVARLLGDQIGDEEWAMLRAIAEDYMARFGEMPPRSGVYYDTQTEENGWTALGLVASLVLLSGHERETAWLANAQRWMFSTVTRPQDMFNRAEFADGQTVRDLCGRIYTTLPDGTAENHGFVHPSYMASALALSGNALNLLKLYDKPAPPHIFWRRQEQYDLLKSWADQTGAFHCVQGMDWPYFAYPQQSFIHATANVYLHDRDGALLESYVLDVLTDVYTAHDGRSLPAETLAHCHGQQDPSVMRERLTSSLAYAALAHRMAGRAEPPTEAAKFERRMAGVRVYPHGSALIHRHARGINSLAWRNRTMALPTPLSGSKIIGPADGSMLATVIVRDHPESTDDVALTVREGSDRAAVVLAQDLAQRSVRRYLFFATLPDGRCLTVERLVANKAITVESVEQGYLSVINDGYFGEHADKRGRRTLYWPGGEETFIGYPTGSGEEGVHPGSRFNAGHMPQDPARIHPNDTLMPLHEAGQESPQWVNVDDRFGIVYRGTGRAYYLNRRHFPIWHAIEDDLVLSAAFGPQEFAAGDRITELVALWHPEQAHTDTAAVTLNMHETGPHTFAATIDGFFCAANFSAATKALPVAYPMAAAAPLSLGDGMTIGAPVAAELTLSLGAWEPALITQENAAS